jgi:hypothetical protein
MRHNKLLKPAFLFLILALFALGACNQDPIFHEISEATKPLEARIKGTPTNMVVFTRGGRQVLYVASGSSLYSYTGTGWDKDPYKISDPGGIIRSLAATSSYLYALTYSGLKRISTTGTAWESTADSSSLEIVCAAGNRVFAGKRNNDQYSISYLDEGNFSLHSLQSDTGELTGVAFNGQDYYLSTKKRIYKVTAGTNTIVGFSVNKEFLGIISLENGTPSAIVAIEREGELYWVNDSGVTSASKDVGSYASGALALWQNTAGTTQLLLAGHLANLSYSSSTSYTYGYKELVLSNGTISGDFKEPGTNPTSMHTGGNYTSSIGKYPVNHLFQVPAAVDSGRILFASTGNQGLWSYRNRSSNGGWQWNAEE